MSGYRREPLESAESTEMEQLLDSIRQAIESYGAGGQAAATERVSGALRAATHAAHGGRARVEHASAVAASGFQVSSAQGGEARLREDVAAGDMADIAAQGLLEDDVIWETPADAAPPVAEPALTSRKASSHAEAGDAGGYAGQTAGGMRRATPTPRGGGVAGTRGPGLFARKGEGQPRHEEGMAPVEEGPAASATTAGPDVRDAGRQDGGGQVIAMKEGLRGGRVSGALALKAEQEVAPAGQSLAEVRLDARARNKVQAALARLDRLERAKRALGGEEALRRLVADVLEPMLSGWLEENLADIVERRVAEEIARITGQKR